MARSPCTFRQIDVTRALRAAKAAGIEVDRIEIAPDGTIIVVTEKTDAADGGEIGNPWDAQT